MNVYSASIENKINIKNSSIEVSISSKKYYPSYLTLNTFVDLNNIFLNVELINISSKKYVPLFDLLYSFPQNKIVKVLKVKT